MEEAAAVKENVNPKGGLLAPSSKRERKLKLGGAQEPRSRERVGVLASNATLTNGGDVDPLEWLKDRLSKHQSVSKNQLEPDSGSKHLRKLRSSPAVDGERLGRVGKPSAGLSSNKMGVMGAGRELSSSFLSHHPPSHSRASMLYSHAHNSVDNVERTTKSNLSSGGLQVGGTKSLWPASRPDFAVYKDDSTNLQVERDSSRREVTVKAWELKSPGAALLPAKGLALKSEIQEHSKVGLDPSPNEIYLSKSQLQQVQECVKELSPQQSHSSGSGFWNGSMRKGTPYNRKVNKSHESVVDQPDRSNTDQQRGSSGQPIGLNLIESQRARTSVTSPGRREVSRREGMVETMEEKSPAAVDIRTGSASRSQMDSIESQSVSIKCEEIKSRIEQPAADVVTGSASRSQSEKGNLSFPTNYEEIKSRIEQHKIKLKRLCSRKPPSSGDSVRSSFGNVQGPLCTYTSPILEKEEVASSPDVKNSQCEGQKLQETTINNEKDGVDFSVDLPYIYPDSHLRDVDHHELGQKIDCRSRAVPCETISKSACWYSEDSANKVSGRRGSSPPPAKTQSASTIIAGSGNRKWSGSGAMWSQAAARSEYVPLDDGLKQNTSNMDVTAVGNDSAHLSTEVTGASSSGSSSTPCVMGNSCLDEPTVKSHKSVCRTPSAEKAVSSSYRLSGAHKLSSINKRSGSLGPPLRVPRDEVESCNSRISALSIAPIIVSDCPAVMKVEVAKNCPPLEHPWSDPKKRKAERDLSRGDGDTSQTLEHTSSAPPNAENEDNERSFQAQRKSAGEPSDMGSMSRTSATGSLVHSKNPSCLLITSKAATTAAFTSRQSTLNQNESDASESGSDSCKIRERRAAPMSDAAELKLSTIPGASVAIQNKISENSHFVWVNDKRYQKIGKIGKGGSSEVYKVIDSDCNIFAMKKINLKGRDHRAAIGFYQEIEYLEKLRGKRNVIQLIDYEVTNRTVVRDDYDEEKIVEDACIYMVLEFGEIDLAGILSKKRKEMMENNENIDDNWLRFYWKHMLLAVKTIHDERIVHADLKPANFLLVQGELKLIDFGIAKAIQSDTTHIVRDSNNMVGTVNYMSPEALMTSSIDEKGRMVKCGRASDIWSLGCILYQMVYGHTPFSQVTSFYAKIQAITSTSHRIEFPAIADPWLYDVMKKCLIWDRYSRPQITDLLEHPFLRPGLANHHKNVV